MGSCQPKILREEPGLARLGLCRYFWLNRPSASRGVSTRHAESVRHYETRCRHEWRHGTQECVRHKRVGRLQQKAADLKSESRARARRRDRCPKLRTAGPRRDFEARYSAGRTALGELRPGPCLLSCRSCREIKHWWCAKILLADHPSIEFQRLRVYNWMIRRVITLVYNP